nr:helix-turn-helix transcriptional regulator [Anaerovorax odorimutans]
MNAIRTSRGQSISEFSEELGISRSSAQKLLKGTGNPRMDTVEHIAGRLEVDPLTLLSFSSSEKHLESALLLLKTLDTVSELPSEKKLKFASLFQELILLMEPET